MPVSKADADGHWGLALASGGYLAASTVGLSNIWNPIGWVVLGVAAVALATVAVVEVVPIVKNAIETYQPTKVVSDISIDFDEADTSRYDDLDDDTVTNRERVGQSKGKKPRNNKKQNRQFKRATRKLSKRMQRAMHDKEMRYLDTYREIVEAAESLLNH